MGQPSPNLFSLKDHTQVCLASSALELGVETFVPDQAELKAVSFRRRFGPWQSLALRVGGDEGRPGPGGWSQELELQLTLLHMCPQASPSGCPPTSVIKSEQSRPLPQCGWFGETQWLLKFFYVKLLSLSNKTIKTNLQKLQDHHIS